jgi:hypothetical protein
MFKYVIQLANTANSLPNLDFDNRYVGSANFQGIFGICMTHKSLLSTRAFRFVHLTYSKFVLQIFIVCKFDDKFRISEWICSYCIWIPIFKHYNCIVNAFARHSNSAPSVMIWGSLRSMYKNFDLMYKIFKPPHLSWTPAPHTPRHTVKFATPWVYMDYLTKQSMCIIFHSYYISSYACCIRALYKTQQEVQTLNW